MIFLGIILLILPKRKLIKKNICVARVFKIIEIDFFTTKLIKSLIVKFNAQFLKKFGKLINIFGHYYILFAIYNGDAFQTTTDFLAYLTYSRVILRN